MKGPSQSLMFGTPQQAYMEKAAGLLLIVFRVSLRVPSLLMQVALRQYERTVRRLGEENSELALLVVQSQQDAGGM